MMKKLFALIISVLIFGIAVCGCKESPLLQPSRAELIRANLFLAESPAIFDLDLKAVSDADVILYYNSQVSTLGENAVWNGTAKIYSNKTYFVQPCKTVCSGTTSQKQWRDSWAKSGNRSPATILLEWLEKAEYVGRYQTTPVVPADCSDYLSDLQSPTYRITWTENAPDWNALCDAHPDTLFGGESLLGNFTQTKVTLFFDVESLALKALLLESEEGGRWLSMTIVPQAAVLGPDIEEAGPARDDVQLSEEWTILYDSAAEGTVQVG